MLSGEGDFREAEGAGAAGESEEPAYLLFLLLLWLVGSL